MPTQRPTMRKPSIRRKRPDIQGMEFAGLPVAQVACSPVCCPQGEGWLGALLGQCCVNPGVAQNPEAELREPAAAVRSAGDPTSSLTEPWTRNPMHNPFHSTNESALHVESDAYFANAQLRAAKFTFSQYHADPWAASYLVDNSLLQVQGRPGVGYRYSKFDADRAGQERPPALWGDVVQGTDEGDGWLKVGHYYLPMAYQGMPVLTQLADPQEVPPTASSSSSASCNKVGLAAMACPVLPVEPGRTPLPTPLPEVDCAATRSAMEASAQMAQAEKQQACPWSFKPSVGTWLQPMPSRLADSTRPAEDMLIPETPAPWRHLPSVGTWLLCVHTAVDLPTDAGTLSPELEERLVEEVPARSVNREGLFVLPSGDDVSVDKDKVPELQLFADVIASRSAYCKKSFEGAAGEDSELSPSTCAPDSPSYMPTPMSVLSEAPGLCLGR